MFEQPRNAGTLCRLSGKQFSLNVANLDQKSLVVKRSAEQTSEIKMVTTASCGKLASCS